ncbi:hypothetical protein [Kineosporia sp. R_H_3]|uniref:hypothetical protein n=1 Tax=Kineosporia sp. R_H_3 TaxID=1961848 RepID=UPI000B4B4D37|nr:hypothetical protein [Kineosporia sp. R_H_3]
MTGLRQSLAETDLRAAIALVQEDARNSLADALDEMAHHLPGGTARTADILALLLRAGGVGEPGRLARRLDLLGEAERSALLRFLVERRDRRGRFVDVWGMAVALVCDRRDGVRVIYDTMEEAIGWILLDDQPCRPWWER